jgi:hypothetical protein
MMYLAFKYHQPCCCNIAAHGPRAAGQPGGYLGAAGCGPSGAAGGTYAALPETVGRPVPTLPGPDPGNAGASCLALCSTTGSSTACSCTWSGEYNAYRFSLRGQPASTNYITWSLCRHRRRVQTRLQVVALHWVLLHRTAGHLTRASPCSRTSGLLHSHRGTPPGRSRGTTGLQASLRSSWGSTSSTVRPRSRVGRSGSKVGARLRDWSPWEQGGGGSGTPGDGASS